MLATKPSCQAKSRMETKPFKAPVDAYEEGVLDSSLNEPFKVVSRDASVGPGIAHPLQSHGQVPVDKIAAE